MANLICDICGTSYSAADDKCPTCGYSRASAELAAEEEAVSVVRERVRGGRFSRKNVLKRMKAQEESPAESETAETLADMTLELGEAVAAADFRPEKVQAQEPVSAVQESQPESPEQEETVPAAPEEVPAPEPEIVMDWPILEVVAAEETEEAEVVPILFPELPEAEETESVDDEIEQPAENAEEEPEVEEAAFEVNEVEEAEEQETEEAPAIPLILPVEEESAAEEALEEEKKKKRAILPMVLIASAAVLLLLLAWLAAPYLKDENQPSQPVAETTEPTGVFTEPATDVQTEPATDAPTEPPTEPPTQAPTEPPTAPPTEPPTEAPTDPPPLEIPLTLNYYDLTFRGSNQGVQMVVEGYRNADITWTSDDPSVVTVTETGKIISVGPGSTVVHATYRGHTVSCNIRCIF